LKKDDLRVCSIPVGKIAGKAVRKSVSLTIWRCILSAELTDHFAHWDSRIPIKYPSQEKLRNHEDRCTNKCYKFRRAYCLARVTDKSRTKERINNISIRTKNDERINIKTSHKKS